MNGMDSHTLPAKAEDEEAGRSMAPVTLGRFVLLDRLGQGGMGVVYAAYDPQLDRKVALKLLHARRGLESSHGRTRMLREAQALAQLSHPNVVPIHDVGVIDEQVFLVMAHLPGQDLRHWVTSEERSWQEIVDTFVKAGRGLAAAHDAGMIHRDFKPGNVRVGHDAQVRVLDFGLARGHDAKLEASPGDDAPGDDAPSAAPSAAPRQARSASALALESTIPPPSQDTGLDAHRSPRWQDSLTQVGALVGTPAFMAPEQFAGETVGPAADQFSFCVALYEALYDTLPFAAHTLDERQDEILAGRVREPPRGSAVPRWVFEVLCRGLAADPGARYPSMDALLREFEHDVARDMRRTRRAIMWFLVIFGLLGTGMATLGMSGTEDLEHQPMRLVMVFALIIPLFMGLVAVYWWRHAFLANQVSRHFMIVVLISMVMVTAERTVGWYLEFDNRVVSIVEMFTFTTSGLCGAVFLIPRIAWLCVCTLPSIIGLVFWPHLILPLMYYGYVGITVICVWVWWDSARERDPSQG